MTFLPRYSLLVLLLSACLYARPQGGPAKATGGTLRLEQFFAPSIDGNRGGEDPVRRLMVYLPPGYYQSTRRYPVIYYLHGYQNHDSTAADFASFKALLDTAINSGHIRPVIVVWPNSNTRFDGSFYSNSTLTGRWGDFIAVDVVSYTDRHFRTLANRNSRGLTGISMGGHGALKIAMLYPGVFGAVYAMTPAVLNWSDGNNVHLSTFRTLDTLKDKAALFDDFRALLFTNLGRTWSPDFGRPPFYAGLPAHYKGDSLIIDSAIYKKWNDNFPTQLIETHQDALRGLRALKMDWGRNDEGRHVPVTCLEFSKKLEQFHIPHYAEEYLGGHADKLPGKDGRIYTEVLPFFDSWLDVATPVVHK